MHSATIPLAALATFAAFYWLTPAPAAAPESEPAAIVEAPASVAGTEAPPASAVPAARRARPRKSGAVRPRRAVTATARPAAAASVYFPGCNAVRAAGLAPLLRGQPGYRPEMDGDDDGIACEPHRGRG
jgi:hypothetical protein